jgi:intein-encoded DNA endonuclease-like protein
MLNTNLIELLIYKYTEKNYTILKLSKKYNITKYKIKKILKENNIEIRNRYHYIRKYKIDTEAFKEINSEDKAYLLGFICADGCIYNNKCLNITIHKKDRTVLELLKKVLRCDTLPIKEQSQNKNINYINVWNKELVSSFKKLNVTERKTFTISMPKNIPNHLHKDFWRGVIDGDGCLYLKEKKNVNNKPTFIITLVGSKNLMVDYVNFLKSINIFPLPEIKSNKNIWAVSLCSKRAIKFCKKIYENDSVFCFQRKKDKFLKALEINEQQKRELPKGMRYVGKKRKIKVAALKSASFNKDYHIGIFDTLKEALEKTKIFYKKHNKTYIPDYGDWT